MKHYRIFDDRPTGGRLYRKHLAMRLWYQSEPFECESVRGVRTGQAGDFLAEDGDGGFYPISAEFVARNYEPVED